MYVRYSFLYLIFLGLLYGGLVLVPGLLYLLSCRGIFGEVNLDYNLIVCVYGYSTIPLIPICILCSLPFAVWRSLLVAVGFVMSVVACYKYLWRAAAESLPKPVRGTLLGVAVIGQALNWAVYRWYFLAPVTK